MRPIPILENLKGATGAEFAYRNGHIGAAEEAEAHIQAYLEALAMSEATEDVGESDESS
jgi:hypothetical protein